MKKRNCGWGPILLKVGPILLKVPTFNKWNLTAQLWLTT